MMAALGALHRRPVRKYLADGAAAAANTTAQQLAVVGVAQVDGQVAIVLLDHHLLRYRQGRAGQPVVQVGVPAVAVVDQLVEALGEEPALRGEDGGAVGDARGVGGEAGRAPGPGVPGALVRVPDQVEELGGRGQERAGDPAEQHRPDQAAELGE